MKKAYAIAITNAHSNEILLYALTSFGHPNNVLNQHLHFKKERFNHMATLKYSWYVTKLSAPNLWVVQSFNWTTENEKKILIFVWIFSNKTL